MEEPPLIIEVPVVEEKLLESEPSSESEKEGSYDVIPITDASEEKEKELSSSSSSSSSESGNRRT